MAVLPNFFEPVRMQYKQNQHFNKLASEPIDAYDGSAKGPKSFESNISKYRETSQKLKKE